MDLCHGTTGHRVCSVIVRFVLSRAAGGVLLPHFVQTNSLKIAILAGILIPFSPSVIPKNPSHARDEGDWGVQKKYLGILVNSNKFAPSDA